MERVGRPLLDEISQVKDNQHYSETRAHAAETRVAAWESLLVMRGLTMQLRAVRDSDPVNLPTPEAVTKLLDEIARLERDAALGEAWPPWLPRRAPAV